MNLSSGVEASSHLEREIKAPLYSSLYCKEWIETWNARYDLHTQSTLLSGKPVDAVYCTCVSTGILSRGADNSSI